MKSFASNCSGMKRRSFSHLMLIGVAALAAGLLFALALLPGAATADSELAAGAADNTALQTESLGTALRSMNDSYANLPQKVTTLLVDEPQEVSLNDDDGYVKWFSFKPETSGVYQFVSSIEDEEDSGYFGDPYGALYGASEDGNYDLELISKDDDGVGYRDFKIISPTLQAGTTYYLACSSCGDETAFYVVRAKAFDAYDISEMEIDYEQEVWDDAESVFDSLNVRIASFETDEYDDPIYLEYQTDFDIEGWYVGDYDDDDEYVYTPVNEPTEPGSYRLDLQGLEPYQGTASVYFELLDSKNLESYQIGINEVVSYSGEAVTLDQLNPRFFRVCYDDEGQYTEEIEINPDYYTVTNWKNSDYEDVEEAVEPGEYYVTISGVESYYGNAELYFSIVSPTDLGAATVTVTPSEQYYTGGDVGYSVEVLALDGTLLDEGVHYIVAGLQRYNEDDEEFEEVEDIDSGGYYRVVIQGTGIDGYNGTVYGEFELEEYSMSIHDEYAYLPSGDVPELNIEGAQQVSINSSNSIRWLSFTPDEDGPYFFKSGGESGDPRARLFKPISEDEEEYGYYDLVSIGYNDDYGDDYDFGILANNLQADVTYYLACGSCEDHDSYTVTVDKYDLYDLACYEANASNIWVGTTVSVEALNLTVETEFGDGEDWIELEYGQDFAFDSWLDSNGNAMAATPNAAGYYYARIKGISPYRGTLDVPFRIKDSYDLSSSWYLYADNVLADGRAVTGDKLGLSLEFEDYNYSGAPLNPVLGRDYKIVAWYDDEGRSIAAPSAIGWYEVEIEGISPYHGKIKTDFSIRDPKNLDNYDYDANERLWENGNPATLSRLGVKLYLYGESGSSLAYNTDYKFKGWYDDDEDFIGDNPTSGPSSAGYYYACFEGINNYTGTIWIYFEIADPHHIDNYDHPRVINVAYDGQPMTFEKLGFELAATAENGSKMSLQYGTHYEFVEWAAGSPEYDDDDNWFDDEVTGGEDLSDIVDEGYYYLTFRGIEPYYGSTTVNLRVVDASDLTYAVIEGLQDGAVYHNNFSVNPTVYAVNGQKLTAGTDYTLTLQRYVAGKGYQTVDKVTEPGRYRVLVEGKSPLFGGYSGQTEQYFEVLADSAGKYNIANATISGLSNQTYAGTAFTPAPVVKLAGAKLVANKDYTVSYANNTNAGTATVTVTGIGFYKGSKSATFTINKAAGSIAIKAKSKKALTAKSGKKTTIKASKAFKVTKNVSKGKVTYKKTKGNKKIVVAKNGKITVKKGLKKGVYKIKVKATSAMTANYNAATSKVITVKIKVK